MTLADLNALARWEDGSATFAVDVPLFGGAVDFTVAAARDGVLSERTAQTVRQVQALGPADHARLLEVVWENCLLNVEGSSYGFDIRDGQTETEANLEAIGVHDAASALARTRLRYCRIDEEDQSTFTANYAVFFMDNAWETHGLDVVVRDGRVVGGGENGVWLGRFEPPAGK